VIYIPTGRGITRPNMTQQVGRAQHEPTYNGPIYYRLSILSGRVQQTFSMVYALLDPVIDTPLSTGMSRNLINKYIYAKEVTYLRQSYMGTWEQNIPLKFEVSQR